MCDRGGTGLKDAALIDGSHPLGAPILASMRDFGCGRRCADRPDMRWMRRLRSASRNGLPPETSPFCPRGSEGRQFGRGLPDGTRFNGSPKGRLVRTHRASIATGSADPTACQIPRSPAVDNRLGYAKLAAIASPSRLSTAPTPAREPSTAAEKRRLTRRTSYEGPPTRGPTPAQVEGASPRAWGPPVDYRDNLQTTELTAPGWGLLHRR